MSKRNTPAAASADIIYSCEYNLKQEYKLYFANIASFHHTIRFSVMTHNPQRTAQRWTSGVLSHGQ